MLYTFKKYLQKEWTDMFRRIPLVIATSTLLLVVLTITPVGFSQIGGSAVDLIPISITLNPENVGPGDQTTIQATIQNEGSSDSSSFFVNIRAGSSIIASQRISGIDAGRDTIIQTIWFVDPSVREIKVDVDTTNRVDELDESNNSLSLEITFAPDFVIQDVEFIPAFPKPNEQIRILITVLNDSGNDVTQNIGVQVSRGREVQFGLAFIQGGLAAGESEVVEITRSSIPTGEQVIRIQVDHRDSFVELDEFNNVFESIINVTSREPTGAELEVSNISFSPSNPSPGDVVTLQATVANNGNGASGSYNLALQVDGSEQDRQTGQTLSAGTTTVHTFLWVADEGESTLRLKVDPDGLIPELNEANNATAIDIDLNPPLNSCGQFAWLNVSDEAIQILQLITGLDEEAVRTVFLPKMRDIVVEQYEGINIRFTFEVPSTQRATISFTGEDRGSILGLAPIGLNFGTGFVFLGSFNIQTLQAQPLTRQAIAIGTVASHELGHLLGLGHTSEREESDIMSATAEVVSASGIVIPKFTPPAHDQLATRWPLDCF